MDLIQAAILGIIEGITEFLPISSTGHLILASNLMHIAQTEFVKTFEIAIQSGAILSVIILYSGKMRKDFELGKRVLVAFIPTAVIGFILYKMIKHYLIGNPNVVLLSLLVCGVALIGVELLFKAKSARKIKNSKLEIENSRANKITYENALVIGLFQSIAVIPGVSRSASTIVGGMLLGLDRKTATEFSFLLAVPTMLAATALDLKETSINFTQNEWMVLLVGFCVSFIVAYFAIKWLVEYVKTNNFIPFGLYRIILSIVYFLLVFPR